MEAKYARRMGVSFRCVPKRPESGDDKNSPRGRPASLQEPAELEADVLRVVLVALDQREPEVNRDGRGAEDREGKPHARADAGADDAEADVVLDVAEVREEHAAEHVLIDREADGGGAGEV